MTPKQQRHTATENGDQPDTLATLIRREQDLTGASYADIAKASGLSKAKIGQIAQSGDKGQKYQVRPDTIDKLARGLRLPVSIVKRAALATAGITDDTGGNVGRIELITYQLEQLDPKTLGIVEAMVTAAARASVEDG